MTPAERLSLAGEEAELRACEDAIAPLVSDGPATLTREDGATATLRARRAVVLVVRSRLAALESASRDVEGAASSRIGVAVVASGATWTERRP